MTNYARHRRHGFTLVEMGLSMAVMTVLLGGISSALILAGRAIPDHATPVKLMTDGFHVADQLAGELYAAQTISARSANSITFTVADRNADANPETIQYLWSGVAGSPLYRQYNGASASVVLGDIYQFNLTYFTQVIGSSTRVTVVNITLRAGSDSASRVDTSVQLLNQPL